MNDNRQELIAELKEILSDSELDYDSLLEKSSQLAKLDHHKVRFTVDANLVKRLGEQLVAKKTTALSELIKNAYDADASTVNVYFKDTYEPNGSIIIYDDGIGMTREQLINGFMRISTTDKEDNPISPHYKRTRAGRKGIGRFSSQKIGERLRIITRTNEANPYSIIDIDWNEFLQKKELTCISSIIQERDNFAIDDIHLDLKRGTILVIDGVREAWQESNIKTAYKYITGIIKTPLSSTAGSADPGFTVNIYRFVDDSYEIIVNEATEFLTENDAVITACVDDSGIGHVIIKGRDLDGFNFEEELIINDQDYRVLNTTNIKLNAYYFSLAKEKKYRVGLHALQEYTRDNGGIKLYRNGFSVPPYGERNNDWLSLDDSSRRRRILGPHANTNFIGNVEIFDHYGSLFEETSSREGVIENENFILLSDFIYKCLRAAVNRLTLLRGRKATSNQAYEKQKKEQEPIDVKIKNELQRVREIIYENEKPQHHHINFGVQESGLSLKYNFDRLEQLTVELIDETSMYKVLASTGLAIAQFTHEIHQSLTSIKLISAQLTTLTKEIPNIKSLLADLNDSIEMLVAYTDFFDGSIRSNSNRERNVYEIRYIFNKFKDSMSPSAIRKGYELNIRYDSWDIWTKPIHISELLSVLINLYTNSCKAIMRAGNRKGSIYIEVKSSSDDIVIRFSDNGDGIQKKNWANVFNPLFTTEVPSGMYSSDNIITQGMGLGLSISKDLIEGLDGTIGVVEPDDGYSTCIEIVIPKAQEHEIPENAY